MKCSSGFWVRSAWTRQSHNRGMRAFVFLFLPFLLPAQTETIQGAIQLAESNHCDQAIPQLRRMLGHIADVRLKKQAEEDGLRCAMSVNSVDDALAFLIAMNIDFRNDPEALYLGAGALSDLSARYGQTLLSVAPNSPDAHVFRAEASEAQGKWDDAAAEYRRAIQANPQQAGLHFRLGRMLLNEPPTATSAVDGVRELEQELRIDPKNAEAEFILGDHQREAGDFQSAAVHFNRAVQIDPNFGDAYLGLGMTYLQSHRPQDATLPLERAERLEPGNPAVHGQLAQAYSEIGRTAEAQRETQMQQRQTPAH
jgi:Tfp pilus assembly protein PilF